jgi:hypothetical protein
MRRLPVILASLGLASLAVAACERELTDLDQRADPAFGVNPVVQEQYIVVLNDGVDPSGPAADFGVQAIHTYRTALSGFSATLPASARAGLEADPRVRWIEPVVMHHIDALPQEAQGNGKGKGGGGGGDKPCKPRPNKPCPPPPPPPPPPVTCDQGTGQPDDDENGQSGLWGLRRVNVRSSTTWNNNPVNIDIAVLDTGADLDHPDLCIQQAVSFEPNETTPDDFHGHGSHTSGTAGARDDNGLVVGVSPTARIWTVKVCNAGGTCPNSAIVQGIDYVAANAGQIDVANMSIGGRCGLTDCDQPHATCNDITGDAEHLAICRAVEAGVTFAVSAGNSTADLARFVPAAYDEVITVTSMTSTDAASGFSNFATLPSDLAHTIMAPGSGVLSDWLNGGTATASGTSMASPHVAGAAGLWLSNNPGATPAQVLAALLANAQSWTGQGGNHPEPLLDVTNF